MNHLTKGTIYDAFKFGLMDGLVVSSGEKWKSRRKIMDKHIFSHSMILSYMEIFNKEANRLVNDIEETHSIGKEMEVATQLKRATLNAITSTIIPISAHENYLK